MCIFATHVDEVSKTRIAAGKCVYKNGVRQFIIYQNDIKMYNPENRNAMILPFPVPDPSSDCICELRDMSDNGLDFWKTCERVFPKLEKFDLSRGMTGGWGGNNSAASTEELPVRRVGGYTCSVAPDLKSLARISKEQFHIAENVKNILTTHYATGFGFVVCLFDSTIAAPHPICIISNTLPNGNIFIPTRHAHGEENPESEDTYFAYQKDWPEWMQSRAVHRGHTCDGCRLSPIRGNRWHCTQCPRTVTLCDNCYTMGDHRHRHPFVHISKPLSFVDGRNMNQASGSHNDEFDHTLFLFDCVLEPNASFDESAGKRYVPGAFFFPWNELGFTPQGWENQMGTTYLSRYTIKGGHHPNEDLIAVG